MKTKKYLIIFYLNLLNSSYEFMMEKKQPSLLSRICCCLCRNKKNNSKIENKEQYPHILDSLSEEEIASLNRINATYLIIGENNKKKKSNKK